METKTNQLNNCYIVTIQQFNRGINNNKRCCPYFYSTLSFLISGERVAAP